MNVVATATTARMINASSGIFKVINGLLLEGAGFSVGTGLGLGDGLAEGVGIG